MSLVHILQEFARDKQVDAIGILVLADVIFGVLAAVKAKTFQLARIVDTLHDDVLAKVVPWLALFVLGKVTTGAGIGVGSVNVDFGSIADGFFVGITAAMAASILKSLADLGVKGVPPVLAGPSKP